MAIFRTSWVDQEADRAGLAPLDFSFVQDAGTSTAYVEVLPDSLDALSGAAVRITTNSTAGHRRFLYDGFDATTTDQRLFAITESTPLVGGFAEYLYARFTDASNNYRAYLDTDGFLAISKTVGGASEDLDVVAFAWVAGRKHCLQFEVVGTSLRARAWDYGDPVPGWMIEVTDSDLSAGRGGFGLNTAVGSSPGYRCHDFRMATEADEVPLGFGSPRRPVLLLATPSGAASYKPWNGPQEAFGGAPLPDVGRDVSRYRLRAGTGVDPWSAPILGAWTDAEAAADGIPIGSLTPGVRYEIQLQVEDDGDEAGPWSASTWLDAPGAGRGVRGTDFVPFSSGDLDESFPERWAAANLSRSLSDSPFRGLLVSLSTGATGAFEWADLPRGGPLRIRALVNTGSLSDLFLGLTATSPSAPNGEGLALLRAAGEIEIRTLTTGSGTELDAAAYSPSSAHVWLEGEYRSSTGTIRGRAYGHNEEPPSWMVEAAVSAPAADELVLIGAREASFSRRILAIEVEQPYIEPPSAPTVTVQSGPGNLQAAASPFVAGEPGDEHAETRWQVALASDPTFASAVTITTDEDLDSILLGGLLPGTAYLVRAAYRGAGTFGPYSAAAAATTGVGPSVATLTLVDVASTSFLVSSSAFASPDAGRSHVGTRWQVALASDPTFADPELDEILTGDGLLTFAPLALAPSTAFLVRAYHLDDAAGTGPWSSSLAVTTTAAPASQPTTPVLSLAATSFAPSPRTPSSFATLTVGLTYGHPLGTPHRRTQLQITYQPTGFPTTSLSQLYYPAVEFQVESIPPGETVRYRARTQDTDLAWSEWSEEGSYTNVLEGARPAPMLVAPEAGFRYEPGATIVAEWLERKRDDELAVDYSYELQATLDEGETWTTVATGIEVEAGIDAGSYEWTPGWTEGVFTVQFRIRVLSPEPSEFHYGGPWWFDADGEVEFLPTPGSDPGLADFERSGDLNQQWGTTDGGDSIERLAPATLTELGRVTNWGALELEGTEEWVGVDMMVTMAYRGQGIDGDLGPSGAYRYYPTERCWGGVGVDFGGTTYPPDEFGDMSGISVALGIGPVWSVGDYYEDRIRGLNSSTSAALRIANRTPWSSSPAVAPEPSLRTVAFPRNSIAQDVPPAAITGFPGGYVGPAAPAVEHTVRMRVTILGRNSEASAYPGAFSLRIQSAYHSPWSSAGQGAGWDDDVIRHNVELACGRIGLFGAGIDYLSNAGVQRIAFRNFAYRLLAECETPPPDCARGHRVTFFEDDGITARLGEADSEGNVIEASFYSHPTCPRPFMKEARDWGDQQVDFRAGSLSVGTHMITVLDKREVATDQRTGVLTRNIVAAAVGRRAVYEWWRDDLERWVVVSDGIVDSYELDATAAAVRFTLRDQRVRESVRIFTRNDRWVLHPEDGPAENYGRQELGPGEESFLYEAVDVAVGTYTRTTTFDGYVATTRSWGTLSAMAIDAGAPALDLGQASGESGIPRYYYPNATVRWRPVGEEAWTYLRNMPGSVILPWSLWSAQQPIQVIPTLAPVRVHFASDDPALLPGAGQEIEYQVLYAGPPNDEAPLFWEGSFGDLILAAYRGDFSARPPRIAFDEEAFEELAASTPTARMVIRGPEDSMRRWLETNAYAPLYLAPRYNLEGRIEPVYGAFPDAEEELPEITNDEAIAGRGGWIHGLDNAVHSVRFTYLREYIDEDAEDPADRLQERTVEPVYVDLAAAEVVDGEITYAPVTVRSIGAPDTGAALSADPSGELGGLLANELALYLLPRFRFGAPRLRLDVRASVPAMRTLLPGSWVRVRVSWLPDYSTAERGLDRYLQVVGVKYASAAAIELTLEDGGATGDAEAVVPTLDSLSVNSSYQVVGVFSDVPATGVVRMDFATGASAPASSSNLWRLAGRRVGDGAITTIPVSPGTTVWIRFRGEATGARPTIWSEPVSVVVTDGPFLYSFALTMNAYAATVTWTASAATGAVLIEFDVHLPGVAPVYAELVPSPPGIQGFAVIPEQVPVGSEVSVRATPYATLSGGAATGASGPPRFASGERPDVVAAAITSAAVLPDIVATGDCDEEGMGLVMAWTVTDGAFEGHTISIERSVDEGAYTLVVSGLPTITELTGFTYRDEVVGVYNDAEDPSAVLRYYRYRISLYRTADGALLGQQITNSVYVYEVPCPGS